jgi:Rps23 Pro-64 3,4-dihydroxylase Tpa1-like proline 4-hydroxylase
MNRHDLATLIVDRLASDMDGLQGQFTQSGTVPSCYIDDLLPQTICRQLYQAFPPKHDMVLKKSLRENKYVAAQMNKYDPLLEGAIFAFQDQRVVDAVHKISGIPDMFPDSNLYAGGISLMAEGSFLNPHLDNSHDKDRERYRVVNLLYYVTPDWQPEYGGNLELWDDGLGGEQRTIYSKCNRLVLMATNKASWHSVSKVVANRRRCCLSNYYFSTRSPESDQYFHVSSFRGRPNEPVRDKLLQGDAALRMVIRKAFKKGIVENPHVYKR